MSKYNEKGIALNGDALKAGQPVLLWQDTRDDYSATKFPSRVNFLHAFSIGVYDVFDHSLSKEDEETTRLVMLEALFESLPTVMDYIGMTYTYRWNTIIDTEVIKKFIPLDATANPLETTSDPLNQKHTFGIKMTVYIVPSDTVH